MTNSKYMYRYILCGHCCSRLDRSKYKGASPGFSLGPRAGVGFLGRGSNPLPPARGLGSAELPHRDSGPKGFPLFSAITMASVDAIVLLTVDHKKMENSYPIQS